MKKILSLVALCLFTATSVFAQITSLPYTAALSSENVFSAGSIVAGTKLSALNVNNTTADLQFATNYQLGANEEVTVSCIAYLGWLSAGKDQGVQVLNSQGNVIGGFSYTLGSCVLSGITIADQAQTITANQNIQSFCKSSNKNANGFTNNPYNVGAQYNTVLTVKVSGSGLVSVNVKNAYRNVDITATGNLGTLAKDIKTIRVYSSSNNGDRTIGISDLSITSEVIAKDPAQYTLKKVCGTTTIEEKVIDAYADDEVSKPTTENIYKDGKKYIYVSDDATGKTIAADNSTVVTVNFREAATWNYTLVDDKNNKIAGGSNFEGENIAAGYPRFEFNKKDSTLVEADVTNKEYRKSFALDANNKTVSVAYTKGTQKNIVFYTEGEDISGTTINTTGNVAVRASNALAVSTSKDVLVTKLPAGKYKIHVGSFTSKSSNFQNYKVKLAVGTKVHEFACQNANLSETVSEEIVLSVTTPVYYLAEGSGNDCQLDYIFIEKTGYMAEAENPYGDWLEVDNTGNTGDKVDEGYLVVDPTTKQENGMITFPEETPETEGADAGDAATGINNAQTAGVQVVGIYSANGAKAAQLQKGLNIIKLANGKTVKVVK